MSRQSIFVLLLVFSRTAFLINRFFGSQPTLPYAGFARRWHNAGHFAQFIREHESPGLLLIHSQRPIGSAIEGLLLVWMTWTEEELRNKARWLP